MALKLHLDFYCTKVRCEQKELKERGSTKLKLIKEWRATGHGGNYNDWAILEGPNCNHRYRKHIRSGRDIENPEVAKKRMAEALLGLHHNIEAEYGRDST